jgi:hypothetical protein
VVVHGAVSARQAVTDAVAVVVFAGIGSLAWAFYLVLGRCIAAVGVAWWRFSPSKKAPS